MGKYSNQIREEALKLKPSLEKVARGLSGEKNLKLILAQKYQTCTNGKEIFLRIPSDWPPNFLPHLRGSLFHELGHVFHTPIKEWEEIFNREEVDPIGQIFINSLEDIRIDNLISKNYPGIERDLKTIRDWLTQKYLLDGAISPQNKDEQVILYSYFYGLSEIGGVTLEGILADLFSGEVKKDVEEVFGKYGLDFADKKLGAEEAYRIYSKFYDYLKDKGYFSEDEDEKSEESKKGGRKGEETPEEKGSAGDEAENSCLENLQKLMNLELPNSRENEEEDEKREYFMENYFLGEAEEMAKKLDAKIFHSQSIRKSILIKDFTDKTRAKQSIDSSIIKRANFARNEIAKILSENKRSHFKNGFTSGKKLDTRKVYRVKTANDNRVFARREKAKKRSYSITILIDGSSSMREFAGENPQKGDMRKFEGAVTASYLAAQIFSSLGIECEIYMFRDSISKNYIQAEQSLKSCLHSAGRSSFVLSRLKKFGKDFTSEDKQRLLSLDKEDFDGDTPLYSSLEFLKMEISGRQYSDKIIVVVTDGRPNDSSPLDVEDLVESMRETGIEVYALGVPEKTDIPCLETCFAPDFVLCESATEIPDKLVQLLRKRLK